MNAPVRFLGVMLAVSFLAACPEEPTRECDEFGEVFVWTDLDGDGFGVDPIGWVCEAGPDEATNNVDCDDADPTVMPGADEVCDLVDNDCDGSIDETVAKMPWYPDADGDGYGNNQNADFACLQPSAIHVEISGDCDDNTADVNPLALEVCNEIDDDCDTLIDDSDGGVDPDSKTSWYQDADMDGFGRPDVVTQRCAGPPNSSEFGTDCDDTDATISPAQTEICNDIDDDCDALIDDYDDYVDPATQSEFFADADVDGYGDPNAMTMSCEAVNGASDNGDDCDDNDPLVTIPTDWYVDVDGDTYGSGAVISYGCFPPGASGFGPGVFGLDCDETRTDVNPGEEEICGDGVDNDCSGSDQLCGPIGSFRIMDGPTWTGDPPVRSCIETCAYLFGGVATDYNCSTSNAFVDNMAFLDGWGDSTYCFVPRPEDWSFEQAGNPGYNCGFGGCAYSAYVLDHACSSRNWCWER